MKIYTLIVLMFCGINGFSQRPYPPDMPGVQILVSYAKMRPMAMVKYLTETGNSPWKIDSDYYHENIKMRQITITKYGYSLTTLFNDEQDNLSLITPPDTKFYNGLIDDLKQMGLKKKDERTETDFYFEIWDDVETNALSATMIGIYTSYDAGNNIESRKYTIIMHP